MTLFQIDLEMSTDPGKSPGGSPPGGSLPGGSPPWASPTVRSPTGRSTNVGSPPKVADQSRHGPTRDTEIEIAPSTPEASSKVESPTTKLKRSASSSAVKPRTSWCPVVLKGKKAYQIHIMWKAVRNNLELYKVKGKDRSKRYFGLVIDMRAEPKLNEKGELGDYFAVKNEYGEVVNFKSSLLNLGMMGGNSFTKCMIGLRADGGDMRLAAFIAQLSKCKGFSNSDAM